jgi:hypothetical protein
VELVGADIEILRDAIADAAPVVRELDDNLLALDDSG